MIYNFFKYSRINLYLWYNGSQLLDLLVAKMAAKSLKVYLFGDILIC